MHCTWFNEKKKVHFPHIYFFCFFFVFSLLTRPHISCGPRRLSPDPHSDTWERSGPQPLPAPAAPPGALCPGPAGLQLPTSPGRAPRRTRLPPRPRPRLSSREGARAAGQGVPSPPLSALTLFSQPN